jgi:phosphate starvation-inducible PhoH-like protein
MFLTRLGSGSRAIITGDITQVDLPFGKKSGLTEAMKVLRGIDDIAIHEFNERDVVRHRLVQKIVVAYDKYERENRAREEEKREEKKFKIVKRDKA